MLDFGISDGMGGKAVHAQGTKAATHHSTEVNISLDFLPLSLIPGKIFSRSIWLRRKTFLNFLRKGDAGIELELVAGEPSRAVVFLDPYLWDASERWDTIVLLPRKKPALC